MQRGIGPFLTLVCFGLALALSPSAGAATRGISVELRASEAPGAPVSETVRLYEKFYALVIGIDRYTRGWPRLSNAVRDAELVAAALQARGFFVTLETNLGASELEDTLESFFIEDGADPEARLFMWFACHGYTERREGYLVH